MWAKDHLPNPENSYQCQWSDEYGLFDKRHELLVAYQETVNTHGECARDLKEMLALIKETAEQRRPLLELDKRKTKELNDLLAAIGPMDIQPTVIGVPEISLRVKEMNNAIKGEFSVVLGMANDDCEDILWGCKAISG